MSDPSLRLFPRPCRLHAACPAAAGAGPLCEYGQWRALPGNIAGGTLAGEATAQYFNDQVGNTVLFAANQTTLSGDARAVLARQAEWLNKHGNFSAVVQGHAEETGTREYNLALGARRASAVQEYLVAQGVSSDRIRTLSFGKERPAEICSNESCYAQNRRAVTVVSDTGAGT
ncbi:peptidoglycan-associated lipoprotein Pal [Paracoccus methylarcula]|uniref:Peptidoglycan-associated lipoprotein Pal n=1 Tax=Paracoccus methylarcula TaxID=72022 RepID=A0A3R7NVI4_9RHOB|nr:peptidoglycan-associated lipoprotein Pal [Paracoccus methylarcula]